jgi:hypothetical protein
MLSSRKSAGDGLIEPHAYRSFQILDSLTDCFLIQYTQGAAAKLRSFDAFSTALGEIVDLFSVTEYRNFFKAVAYEAQ